MSGDQLIETGDENWLERSGMGSIGRYRLVQLVSEGGMGQVYRAFDQQMERYVALKKMKANLLSSERAKRRFLHEARLTASLNHPSIIPIFEISNEGGIDYYTMPFIQGTNLKESLRHMKQRGEDLHIMACTRIFTSVCQAVAHAHAAGILHRDIKAENIMLGQNEQVLILDWGLACWKGHTHVLQDEVVDADKAATAHRSHQTQSGKIVGTLAYLPPERLKDPATEQSDIYSLGVLLYLMLTYQLPFQRKTAREFRMSSPLYPPDPRQAVPHRDIPETLVRIIQHALHPDPKARYQSSQQLVGDLQTFLEGRSSWYLLTQFDPAERSQWSIQENMFVDRWPVEISSMSRASWVLWMVSKPTTSGNFRIETTFVMRGGSQGFGLLFNLPDAQERIEPLGGFLLWISAPGTGGICLCRDGSLLVDAPHIQARDDLEHTVRIEKIENRIFCSFDQVPCIAYVSTLPLVGTHIGLMQKEGGPEIRKIEFFAGGLSLRISCLAVPDHFLAARDYAKALAEYRRIATVFCGHSEGQKARFLAGITLLEMSRECALKRGKNSYFQQALSEFQQLRSTPSAPLEWLGKALTYRFWDQWNEEANCLELGCLRYPTNPKRRYLREEVVSQLFLACGKHRKLATRLVLLLARTLPDDLFRADTFAQIEQLRAQLDLPPHLTQDESSGLPGVWNRWQLGLEMSYWLWRPQAMIDSSQSIEERGAISLSDIFYLLRLMGTSHAKADRKIKEMIERGNHRHFKIAHIELYQRLRSKCDLKEVSSYLHLHAIDQGPEVLRPLFQSASAAIGKGNWAKAEALYELTRSHFSQIAHFWQWVEIKALTLLAKGDQGALMSWLLQHHREDQLQRENHPLFPLYASAELLGPLGLGPTIWDCAQFARKISTRLTAQCVDLAQRNSLDASRRKSLQRVRELSNSAFIAEKKRVHCHLLALLTALKRPERTASFQFLLQRG